MQAMLRISWHTGRVVFVPAWQTGCSMASAPGTSGQQSQPPQSCAPELWHVRDESVGCSQIDACHLNLLSSITITVGSDAAHPHAHCGLESTRSQSTAATQLHLVCGRMQPAGCMMPSTSTSCPAYLLTSWTSSPQVTSGLGCCNDALGAAGHSKAMLSQQSLGHAQLCHPHPRCCAQAMHLASDVR